MRDLRPPPGFTVLNRVDLILLCRSDMPALQETACTPGDLGRPSTLSGRSTLRIIEPDMVVRRLMHGGALRHVTGWRFASPGRSLRELEVSLHLASHGVPTPEILAVRIQRQGWFHRIDVITRLVPDSADLLTFLEAPRPDCGDIMLAAGALIRRMHDLGVYHADLHIKNILRDSGGGLWLLDLDKACRFEKVPGFMKRLNLRRFIHSANKWNRRGRIHLCGDWSGRFMDGYHRAS
ncbi:MAG TPA: lipopolysaccharide kinase InaA family protein [Deltaproteobacteria bacterium]|nr:lipopolysaccharide kinase InaA family protein [Deltaproteobacteria bacterium]HQI81649.1 lipopolysaccharide kinase InaA family protein [Deltaproteobacteria bacterium]